MNTQDLGHAQQDGSELMPEVVNGKVDARSVHEALEVATPFDKWIRRRIEEFGFSHGEDYQVRPTDLSSGQPGFNRIDYTVTLDMAKELAMVERNEMGRKMRRYFISCEQRLVSAAPAPAVAGGMTPGILGSIQAFNNAVAAELSVHVQRIEKLESEMRPGPEWQSPASWLGSAVWPLRAWSGRLAKLSAACTQKSAAWGLPLGREHYRLPGGSRTERRTFSPRVLAAVCPPYMARWARRDAETTTQGGSVA